MGARGQVLIKTRPERLILRLMTRDDAAALCPTLPAKSLLVLCPQTNLPTAHVWTGSLTECWRGPQRPEAPGKHDEPPSGGGGGGGGVLVKTCDSSMKTWNRTQQSR